MREARTLLAILALLAIALLCLACSDPGLPPRAPAPQPPAQVRQAEPTSPIQSDVGFRTPRLLEEHYRKHGREAGARSEAEYLRMAQALRDRPVGGPILEEERSDGVFCRFDRSTGLFLAYERDGTIKTCFRPNDGEAYFRRQMDRARGR